MEKTVVFRFSQIRSFKLWLSLVLPLVLLNPEVGWGYITTGVRVAPAVTSSNVRQVGTTDLAAGNYIIERLATSGVDAEPTISSLLPNAGTTGTALPVFTITGTGFEVGATVSFGGTLYPATVNSATQLTISNIVIPATAGLVGVVVSNPTPGGASVAATFTALMPAAGIVEDFEAGTKTGFTSESVLLTTGSWTLSDALISDVGGSDLGTGNRTSRIKEQGSLAMDFDIFNEDGTITLKAGAYGSDAAANHLGSFLVEVFNNGMTTGTPAYISSPVTVTSTLQTYTFHASVSGNIRVKITNMSTSGNYRINIDDIAISPTKNQPASTYTWTGQGSNNGWSTPANWSPARTAPAGTDILIFDGSTTSPVTATLDFPTASQTIGQLQLRNLVSLTLLNSTIDRTLFIDGGLAGDDLTIGAGSVLTMRGGSGFAIILSVTAGETALIKGRVSSERASGSAANRLLGQTPGAILFERGSLFLANAGVTGSPFGTTVVNRQSVVFRDGATFRQQGGGNAFGLAQPSAAAVFERGSSYQFVVSGSNKPSISGRTFGTLEFLIDNSSLENLTENAPLLIQNDLKVGPNAKVGLNLTGGIRIGGNIVVDATGELAFSPTSPNTLTLDGGQEQQIIGPRPIRFDAQTTLTINNPDSIRLQVPIRINGTLNLQNGIVLSSATNLPTLAATATVLGGSDRSYVSGPVARQLPSGTISSQLFPVGKAGNYRPLTLNPIQPSGGTLITVEQREGQPAPLALNDKLERVSRLRRYSISATPALSAEGFEGTVTLSFGPNDKVTDPTAASLVIARTDGTGWNSLGHTASTGPAGTPQAPFVAGTITSAPFGGLETFGTYTLASTDPDATVNPLPVQLLSFAAERQAATVRIHWATATELNSASFEVQRSATGQDFLTIATLAAQGSSTGRHEYAAFDRQPLPGLSYYRLRQLDLDGKEAYSAVVSVAAPGEVRAYPNPVQAALTVELPTAGGRYRVISLLGSVLMAGEMPASMAVLDMTGLPAGLYQLEIMTPAGRDIRKIIKQ